MGCNQATLIHQRNTSAGLIQINEEVGDWECVWGEEGAVGWQKWHFNANSMEIKYYALTS